MRIQRHLKIQSDISEVDGKKRTILILSQFLWYSGVKLGVGDFTKELEYCKYSFIYFAKGMVRQWLCSIEYPESKEH